MRESPPVDTPLDSGGGTTVRLGGVGDKRPAQNVRGEWSVLSINMCVSNEFNTALIILLALTLVWS